MSIGLAECQLTDIPLSIFNPIGMVEQPIIGRLQMSLADIAGKISSEIEDTVVSLISAPTIQDFIALREELFPSYIKLSVALSNIVLAKLNEADLPGLLDEWLTALETEAGDKATAYFGDEARSEILFSIATLKSAYRWTPHLLSNKPADESCQTDTELARKFTGAATWASFHLAALMAAVRKNQRLVPEILQELLDGLRLALMAYSYVRAALDLRKFPEARYHEALDSTWDAEDEALANAD